jgi:hypothetical protein
VAGEDGELATLFAELARVVAEEVAPLLETSSCSARLVERVRAAVASGDADADADADGGPGHP